jgi:iron complex outermembrane receptor protein
MMKRILALLLVSTASFAQEDSTAFEERSLEEIVITGIRAGVSTPVTQKTISKKEIEEIYIGEDGAVLLEKLSPSIISFSDAGSGFGNYNQFRLRSIDQTRVNITLNGIPLNDMVDQGVFFSNFTDFGNSVESVQIQRGVGTSTNGTASYAGSVNFESPRLNQKQPTANLNFLGGSFNSFRTAAEINTGKLNNGLAFYGRYSRTLSEGYKEHSGSDAQSFFFSGGYLGKRDVIKITAFAGKTENDQAYLPVPLEIIDANPRTNLNDPNDTDNFEQEFVQLQYSRRISGVWTFNSSLYYNGSRGVFPFGFNDGATQLNFGLQNDHFGLVADMQYKTGTWEVQSGIHGYIFERRNFNYTSPNSSSPDYDDETDKDEISVFGKVSKQVGGFTFYGDLQFRYVNLLFDSPTLLLETGTATTSRDWLFINPKLGIDYSLDYGSHLYISFGRSGREPTRTDILQGDGSAITSVNIQSVLDENEVSPEFVNDLEVGYRYEGDGLDLQINYYFMSFSDEISLVGALAENSYVPLRTNVENSTRTGLEFDATYLFKKKWTLNANMTFQQTNVERFVNDQGEEFLDVNHIFAPTFTFFANVTFKPLDKLNLSLSGRYVGESFMELSNDDGFVVPDFFVSDASLAWHVSSHVTVGFQVKNLFDERYFTDGAPVDLDFDGNVEGPGFRIQPPRHYFGTLAVSF